jgi:hypothetical protein
MITWRPVRVKGNGEKPPPWKERLRAIGMQGQARDLSASDRFTLPKRGARSSTCARGVQIFRNEYRHDRTFWWTGPKRVRIGRSVRKRSPLTPKEQFMARFLPNEDPFTLEDQLKILGNDELLDFWEESQMLDRYLEPTEHEEPPSMHYENAILNELRLRHSMGEI